jgi:hypothetical protein
MKKTRGMTDQALGTGGRRLRLFYLSNGSEPLGFRPLATSCQWHPPLIVIIHFKEGIDIKTIARYTAYRYDIKPEQVLTAGCYPKIVQARSVLYFRAVRE